MDGTLDNGSGPGRRSPARGAGILLIGQTLSRLIALGFYIILARVLGREGIGEFAVGIAFGTIAAVFMDPGLNAQLIREGARDPSRRREYATHGFQYKLMAALLLLGVMAGATTLLGFQGDRLIAVVFAGGAVLLGQLDDLAAAALTSCERLDVSAGLRLLNKIATSALAAGIALAGGSFSAVCVAFFAGAALSSTLALAVVHARFVPLGGAPRSSSLGAKIRAGLPLALSGALWLVALRIDQVMSSMFGVPVADIGGYNNAIKLKEALIMVPAVFALSYTPVLSRQAEDATALGQSFSRAALWTLGGAVPIAVGAWIVADPLLSWLFGAAFAGYGDLMRWIFVAYAANSLITLLTALVVARHRYSLQAISSGALLAVNIALNLALLPLLGMKGAAIATAVATTVGAGVLLSEARRTGVLRALASALLRSAAAAIPMAITACWLLPVHVTASIAAGAAVYIPVYILLGGLGPGGGRRLLAEGRRILAGKGEES